jgi:lysyl-tRNA synthetase class 2
MTTREVFETRARVISSLRRCLEDKGYIEVETPMLTPKATGRAAKPFETHHNALDITLYARIAPELYLKTARRRRIRKSLRAQSQLPQRGHLVQAQS